MQGQRFEATDARFLSLSNTSAPLVVLVGIQDVFFFFFLFLFFFFFIQFYVPFKIISAHMRRANQ